MHKFYHYFLTITSYTKKFSERQQVSDKTLLWLTSKNSSLQCSSIFCFYFYTLKCWLFHANALSWQKMSLEYIWNVLKNVSKKYCFFQVTCKVNHLLNKVMKEVHYDSRKNRLYRPWTYRRFCSKDCASHLSVNSDRRLWYLSCHSGCRIIRRHYHRSTGSGRQRIFRL